MITPKWLAPIPGGVILAHTHLSAQTQGEVAVGCVLVDRDSGEVLASGHNETNRSCNGSWSKWVCLFFWGCICWVVFEGSQRENHFLSFVGCFQCETEQKKQFDSFLGVFNVRPTRKPHSFCFSFWPGRAFFETPPKKPGALSTPGTRHCEFVAAEAVLKKAGQTIGRLPTAGCSYGRGCQNQWDPILG